MTTIEIICAAIVFLVLPVQAWLVCMVLNRDAIIREKNATIAKLNQNINVLNSIDKPSVTLTSEDIAAIHARASIGAILSQPPKPNP